MIRKVIGDDPSNLLVTGIGLHMEVTLADIGPDDLTTVLVI